MTDPAAPTLAGLILYFKENNVGIKEKGLDEKVKIRLKKRRKKIMRAAKKMLWISSNDFGQSEKKRETRGTMKKTERTPDTPVKGRK